MTETEQPASKKINIGPLPQAFEEHDRFEETEVRWDRIIMAGLALIGLIVLIVVFFSGDSDSESSAQLPMTEQVGKVVSDSEATPVESNPIEAAPDKAMLDRNSETDSAPMNMPSTKDAEVAKPVAVLKDESTEKAAAASEVKSPKQAEKQKEQSAAEVMPPKAEIEKATTQKQVAISSDAMAPAQLRILDKRITKVALYMVEGSNAPAPVSSHQIQMAESGIIKVILETEMTGLRGKKLVNEWYRQEVRQATVKIPVNGDPQRSSSSKFINTQMLGDWHVKVKDNDGRLYLEASFEVVSS